MQQQPPAQRLTLLIAWYSEQTQHKTTRKRLGPQSAMPRCTRSQTWPAALQLPPEGSDEPPPTAAPKRLAVPEASPVWVEVPLATPDADAGRGEGQRADGDADADADTDPGPDPGPLLAVPPSLQQHFFLRTADDVKDRLYAEHGIGGSWAEEGATAQRRKKSRAGGAVE